MESVRNEKRSYIDGLTVECALARRYYTIMYEGKMSSKLGTLIDQYLKQFKSDPADGFSLFDTTLSHDKLVARLERALSEGKPYDAQLEEWDEETRKAVESGEIIM